MAQAKLMTTYAYTETHSRTSYSEMPVKFYVLVYKGVLLSIAHGCGAIHTTDYRKFQEILVEASQRGVQIVTSRLPLFLRRTKSTKTTKGLPLEVRIKREELKRDRDIFQ